MKIRFVFFCALMVLAMPARAELPVEISAEKSLEWDRAGKAYIARGNVVVVRGNAQLTGDTVTARYNDKEGAGNITTLEANGGVIITAAPYKAYGDKAVYTVAKKQAVLTGNRLRAINGDDVLTATERFEYNEADSTLTAIGQARAVQNGRTVTADKLSARLANGADGKQALEKITATGNVTIETDRETITGAAGVYDAKTQKAVLTGDVKIKQGDSWLEGTRAEVDMNSGISQLFGSGNSETDGRVKGVFYPKSVKGDGE